MERFKVTRVNDDLNSSSSNGNAEVALNISELNMRKNSHTVPVISPDRRKFSFAQLTREALPRLDNYRISKRALKRPSLGELHGEPQQKKEQTAGDDQPVKTHAHFKLGWIQGVLIPCLLNIWGVMLFLRLSWVVGQSGVIESLIIIAISAIVCLITVSSLSAISTNGEVKGGGIYYIISRSLGPEFGASVGVVFAFANAVAAAMNTIGFCDSLNDLLRNHGWKIIDGGVNDVRIIGMIALVIMIIICAIGMEWEVKAQNFLVVTIIAAILDFLIGSLWGPRSTEDIAKGFTGFSMEVFKKNLKPDYRFSEGLDQTFLTVFAIYFPSVTGIQAGANICGDLKDPASAIPKGTLLALLISTISYVCFALFAGGTALRDGSGLVMDVVNKTYPYNFDCVANHTCQYGLQNSYSVMQLMSVWGGLIYAGCWAATLSTALTNLLSVPRLVQALGVDRIYPGVIFFSKPYGKTGEPYRGYVLVFFVSATFLLIAELNLIAPLISNFYLAAYALINFCTFHAAFVQPLGWRPTFRYYNAWLSLFGCILCVVIMFLLSWVSSLITITIIFALYLIVMYRKPDVNWGSSTQEQTYKTALSAALRLQRVNDHIKNYHPQILVLCGSPHTRPPLIDLAHSITKHHSLLIVGDIVNGKLSHRRRKEKYEDAQKWLEARKIKAFYNLIDNVVFEDGVRSLIQASGFGKFQPNIVMMGYKADWRTCNTRQLETYFNSLHTAFECRMAVAILSLPSGIDFSQYVPEYKEQTPAVHFASEITSSRDEFASKTLKMMHIDSNLNLEGMVSSTTSITTPQSAPLPNLQKLQSQISTNEINYATQGGSKVPKDVLDAMNVFNVKQEKGTIDVWWLYDDGGLTMLLPYIISTRSNWANCKIRVFALSSRQHELEVEERNMANLLSKLRIDYSSLIMLQGITEKPKDETIKMHLRMLDGFLEKENQHNEGSVSMTEFKQLEDKTNRHLKLREMLKEHSKNANLIVMSLPMPRQGSVSAPLYMSWLDILTTDMPPILLVRGNQSSVLTFYS
ncbi:hypothetical protein PVAND_010505 [Polypedilum vanderplanki]|uniref:Bumetanide-sensitive sodium-(Potassium)-chloride cotransporter n=1 Tax=Polypedilum vanderplanki TaxID=319348 RepID=A0A9J6CGN0_POLVA|nr:hypothetical protein PVAND_010505 [Polypedilum vanderplanki]